MLVATRDPRAFNALDPDTKLVHALLEAWGKWAKDIEDNGWPENTLLGRMIDYGVQGAAQQSKPPVSIPEDIARIDAAVAKLGQIDRKAIVAYYTRWEPMEALAKRLRMRDRELRNVLRRARWRIILRIKA